MKTRKLGIILFSLGISIFVIPVLIYGIPVPIEFLPLDFIAIPFLLLGMFCMMNIFDFPTTKIINGDGK